MLDAATMKLRLPHLASQPDTQIEAALAMALRSIDENVWGELAQDGQLALAWYLVDTNPFGQQAGATGNASEHPGWKLYDDMRKRVGAAYRLVLE